MVDRKWQPTTFLRYVQTFESSSRTALVHTDAGPAYLKAINNPQGPQVLACDLFGTQLARRFGLSTFDVAVLDLTDVDEIPLGEAVVAAPVPAFVSRAEKGLTMGGQRALSNVENISDLPRLIVFDTWVRNCDRYAPGQGKAGQPRMNADNLFLSTEGAPEGKFVLKAIDHGHILTCGRPLDRNLARIEYVKEERVYGLFPFFRGFLNEDDFVEALAPLHNVQPSLWEDLLVQIPEAWDVSDPAKDAISDFLVNRAQFLADRFPEMIFQELNPGMLNFHKGGPS